MASSGNFAVFSGVTKPRSPYSSGANIIGGGLSINPPGSGSFEACVATISPNSGKWYWEYRAGQGGLSSYGRPAIAVSEQGVVKNQDFIGGGSGQTGVLFTVNDGGKRINGSDSSYGNAVSQHDIVQIALDCDNGAVYLGINNTWQNSGDPTSGSSKTGAALTSGIQNVGIDIIHTRYAGGGIDQYNFGQDDTFGGAITAAGNTDGNGHGVFKYAPPTGFLALCSANLPISDDIDPAQTDDNYPGKNFNAITWTGNRSSNSTVNNITGVGFQPDLVWLKFTEQTYDWRLVDSSRGVTEAIRSNQTTAEQTEANGLYQFDSDGFSVKGDNNYNYNGGAFIGYCWKANGGTTTSDSSGDITVTRQTNDAAKFSILTYTGSGSSGNTIAHGLGVKPAMTIIKQRNSSNGWNVWHQGNNNGDYDSFGELNGSAAWYQNQGSNGPFSAAPGTDYLTLTAYGQVNGSSNTYVAYVWADVEGMQKFGSFKGNANNDGPFIYTGFRPRLVFVKNTEATSPWVVWDSARNTFNEANKGLAWNATSTEADYTGYPIDILSNGFKLRTSNATVNSSHVWVYGAWGDVPFKYNNTF